MIFQPKSHVQVENSLIIESFTLYDHNTTQHHPSPFTIGIAVILFLLIETLGNFLLLCTIVYEKFGMDSHKRTVTNQLFSCYCWILIAANIIFVTLGTINVLGLQSKPILDGVLQV